ncbi:MAG: DNA-protecting protein DprA [Candidatus Vogelbacteria bacterium CG10_big_fil_rev_8_21_14_0_10_45_14]|uniref:DNA-protecting protein DprA n=1 Tax=Candidatus Vogelbacteria bacterium CG10_big_fil_rev_8_21_14_0_10_45_14 TaxID=1975042 RepID=A0A2H0RKV1_9BACT|nr:MAG: DNA-protecting protein DprA [Candidatus Vogelbacteria bacterium CG10_big_fil_rev_8_21_14_0_10_45_14]
MWICGGGCRDRLISVKKISEIDMMPRRLELVPDPLREIPQPPKELWVVGELPSLTENIWLTVVGSRRCSSYGKDVCEMLVRGLSGYPVVIVSGLALGLDAIAHRSALENGITTVAIPGSGLGDKVLYPVLNRGLAKEIVNSGGALLSELAPDSRAAMWTFPARNRLMVGISKAVLVVECAERSGTLITAKLALDYNRDLLTVPSSIFSATGRGSLDLLREGATAITKTDDLITELGLEKIEKRMIALSKDEGKVIALLENSLSKDELLRELSMPFGLGNALLIEMEIKGMITEVEGTLRRC